MNKEAYRDFVFPFLQEYDYQSEKFAETYHYDGTLGAVYSPEKTVFRVWSPVVAQVDILYFGKWQKYKGLQDKPQDIWPMKLIDGKVWEYRKRGNLEMGLYLYRVTYFNGEQRTCVDPYAKSVTQNSQYTVIVNPAKTRIKGWKKFSSPYQSNEMIIYEASVRDFTSYPETNIEHKGKFLGLTETGRVNHQGESVGFDYLKKLGITHLQLMPIFDFATVDEENPQAAYNWGYDPLNYQVPEGSFASKLEEPLSRIIDLKVLIQTLHDEQIAVIMDSVFNHVYQVETHPFTVLVPGYYFRHFSDGTPANGTGCGNEIASERSMVRKYILDTIEYWIKEFHIDGFRLDLMGIMDYETVNLIKEKVQRLQPNNIILGEGWNMGEILPENQRATSMNAKKMPGIAFFNDRFRNAISGNAFDLTEKGFVTGETKDLEFLDQEFLADYYDNPLQMIQYVASHDNYTLYDHISSSIPHRDMPFYSAVQNLANSVVLLLPGIPFIHAGQEFMRSKNKEGNSYNLPDSINQLNWDLLQHDTINFFKELIRFRKFHTHFSPSTFAELKEYTELHFLSENLLKLRIKNGTGDFWCFFNAYEGDSYTLVDAGEYEIFIENDIVFFDKMYRKYFAEGQNTIKINPLSVLLMRKM